MEACCFNEVSEQGTYYVVESTENRIVIELRTTSGHIGGNVIAPNTVREIEILIDFDEETPQFQRAVFSRYNE